MLTFQEMYAAYILSLVTKPYTCECLQYLEFDLLA